MSLDNYTLDQLKDLLKGKTFKRMPAFKRSYKEVRKEIKRREHLGAPRRRG